VHVAVRAEKLSGATRASKNEPSDVCTRAALPTAANGDDELTLTVTTRPATVPDTLGSDGAEPPDGEVGLPPLHAVTRTPAAANEAA